MKKPNIIFFGTSAFALPALEALIEHGYAIAAAVTNPDEPAGRKKILTPPPVKIAAERHNIPVFQPETLTIENLKFKISPDLYIIAAYGKIIPKGILDIPKLGALNIHPSLLPRWRGPSPVQFTILSGDAEAGVTIMKIDEKMDHGPIVAQQRLANHKTQIPNHKWNYKELHDRLAEEGAQLLIETLPKYIAGEIAPQEQDESKATYSKILARNDGKIDWSHPAEEIERMVRAYTPWPSAWTEWKSEGSTLRLRIDASASAPDPQKHDTPGLVRVEKNILSVMTGNGTLIVHALTLEGGKTLNADEFLRGHPLLAGAVLG